MMSHDLRLLLAAAKWPKNSFLLHSLTTEELADCMRLDTTHDDDDDVDDDDNDDDDV